MVICTSWEAAVREAGSGPCNRLARTAQDLPEMTLRFAQGKVYSKKADVGSTGTQDSWHLLSLLSVVTSTEPGWQVTAVTQCWQAEEPNAANQVSQARLQGPKKNVAGGGLAAPACAADFLMVALGRRQGG